MKSVMSNKGRDKDVLNTNQRSERKFRVFS